jgi:hypothetical protein
VYTRSTKTTSEINDKSEIKVMNQTFALLIVATAQTTKRREGVKNKNENHAFFQKKKALEFSQTAAAHISYVVSASHNRKR